MGVVYYNLHYQDIRKHPTQIKYKYEILKKYICKLEVRICKSSWPGTIS